MPTTYATLNKQNFIGALETLSRRDHCLSDIINKYGRPPLWSRKPGFPTLVQIILEQQVSLASARAAFERLLEQANPLTPDQFLLLDDRTLREIGFSRQKSGYVRDLASAIRRGDFNLANMTYLDDDSARAKLIGLRGIGPWTADIYLLMALRRPDIWPVGDLALVKAVQETLQLPTSPSAAEMETIAVKWRPWRAVAARIFWHYYLSKGKQT